MGGGGAKAHAKPAEGDGLAQYERVGADRPAVGEV